MLGAIEAGGTKFVCAISDINLNIIDRVVIPTTTPEETFNKVFNFFDNYNLKSIGIGSFGPININLDSLTYGYITSTPKKSWKNTNFLGIFKERYQIPIGWNTDVNAAALGEFTLGAAQNKNSCVYITIGTGFGGGAIVDGDILTNYNHPEMGHFFVPKHPRDKFPGICSYHTSCLEGLASGPAIEKRYGISAKNLPLDHEAWDIQSHYLAYAAIAFTTILSPECIIFGGGVMHQKQLIKKTQKKFAKIFGDYLSLPPIDEYIIPTGLGDDSGIIGSLILAQDALK